MNHLLRGHAPITDEAWKQIDEEANQRLVPALGGRKLVDFDGPHGWHHSATDLGRVSDPADGPADGVRFKTRRVLPLVELRANFTVNRSELEALDRGAVDTDFDSLDKAAHQMAVAENAAIFHGLGEAGMDGIAEASSHDPIPLGSNDFSDYPAHIAKAIEVILSSGVEGPYGVALSPECYTGVVESAEKGGYPLLQHIRKILQEGGDGPMVWAPGLDGVVVASMRGGDFLFESGQDLSIGYDSHDAEKVNLYIEESFTFRVATPEAAVALPK
ncbi:MAG: bacteriocin family protein [Solirubrobacterales bacterium]|nr:bacteriocin family protein [Solirubrobacterales bacterium]